MEEKGEPYKVELIAEHAGKGEHISFYKQGDFTELCAGPHLMSIAAVKAFKLTNTTGAYWRGDAQNKKLCRVYGTAFPKASMLEAHLHMLEEAKKRDHRKLGKELELFTIMEEGPGFPFFLPKGMILKNQLIDYWRESTRLPAIRRSPPPSSSAASCGSAAATGTTIKKICTPPLSTTRTLPLSL